MKGTKDMEPQNGHKKEMREITYQVGRKRGKIQWNDHGNPLTADAELGNHAPSKLWELLQRFAWRAAPILPSFLLLPFMYALPAVIFVLTIVLVYSLVHS
jgi:hypothetical protein